MPCTPELKMEITDCLYQKQVELEYIGLEDANVFLTRKIPWNYQFIIDAFVPPGHATQKSC
jgi:hypothetical protein